MGYVRRRGSDNFARWPAAIYDFTNVNDGEFTFSNTYGIGLLSNENFEGDFAASLLSVSGNHTEKEFVVLRFEDGAYVAISSCCGGGNFRLEYLHGDVSLGWGDNNPLVTNIGRKTWDPTNAFGEALYNTGNTSAELAALKAKWEGDGFNLTLVKKGATICFFIDDTFVDCFTVDAKYADMSFRFGYYVWNPAENSVWNYGYTQDVSSYFDDELTLTAAAGYGERHRFPSTRILIQRAKRQRSRSTPSKATFSKAFWSTGTR